MEPISITVDRKLADYVEAYSATTKPLLRVFLGLAFIGLAAGFINYASSRRDIGMAVVGGLEIAGALATFGALYICVWATPRKMYAAHKAHFFQKYNLTDDGLGISTDFGHSFTGWPGFAKIRETSHLWLLLFNNSFFYILPKRCIPVERLSDAEELLTSHVRAQRTNATGPG